MHAQAKCQLSTGTIVSLGHNTAVADQESASVIMSLLGTVRFLLLFT